MYYYRDKDAREIDIVLEHDGILNPLEIKKTLIQVPNSLKYSHFLTRLLFPGEKVQFQNAITLDTPSVMAFCIYGWVIDVPAGESQILAELYLFLIRPLNCKKSDTIFPEW